MGKEERLAALMASLAFSATLLGCHGTPQDHDELDSELSQKGGDPSASRCVRRAPSVTLSPAESSPVAAGTPVAFTVVVTNNDGNDEGVEPFPPPSLGDAGVPIPEPSSDAGASNPPPPPQGGGGRPGPQPADGGVVGRLAPGRLVNNGPSRIDLAVQAEGRGKRPRIPKQACPPSNFVASEALPEGFSLIQAPQTVRLAPGAQTTLEIVVASGPEASGAQSFSVSYAHERDPSLTGTGSAIYRIEGSDGGCASSISIPRELMITDLSVVEDPVRTAPNGAWTFGRLMENMAGSHDPSEFTMNLLQHWRSDQVVNGFVSPARSAIDTVIAGWPRIPGTNQLDLSRSPLRLLAIVNRIDLRDVNRGQAGEGRFVFGVTDAPSDQFTVILEYKLLAATPADVVAWSNRWHALGSLALPSAEYNDALQAITDSFAGPNVAPNRQNGSALGQLRTNEIALSFPWELRQFELGADGFLHQVSVALTPDISLNGSAALADFVNANSATLRSGVFDVPASFGGAPFLANAITNNIDFWSAPGIQDNEARHQLSLNTCNGCHGAETNTIFLQINPRQPGQTSVLSGFLTGETVNDPVTGAPRQFNDLARRATDLATLVCPSDDLPMDEAVNAGSPRTH